MDTTSSTACHRLGNAWAIGGGSGHGFKVGPALGELTARLVFEDQEADVLFQLDRFKTNAPREP